MIDLLSSLLYLLSPAGGRRAMVLMLGLLAALTACVPPTPPPSPTPWPTATRAALTATPKAIGSPSATRPGEVNSPPPTPAPTPTLPLTNLIVWENLPESQAQALAEEIKTFESRFPHDRVTLKHFDNPADFMTPLLAHEIQFDLVLASPVLLSSLHEAAQIAPMSDFFPASFMDGFASVTLQGASQANQLWGLPDTAGFHLLLFYNRDLVDPPPSTTDALTKLAERLAPKPQPILGLNSYEPLWVLPWLSALGGWLTDSTGRPTLNTPAMVEALKLYLDWHDRAKGLAPLTTYDEARSRFLTGDLAMMIDGDWAIGELAHAGQLDWGVAPLPAVSREGQNQPAQPLVLARYWAISRTATGDKALAAAAFLDYITRPERQLDQADRFGLLPTRRQALDDPVIVNNPILHTSTEQMQAGRVVPLGVNADALLNAMREPLRQALDGQLTPAKAAELMQSNAEVIRR